jgi:hypothetical protein
MHPLDASDFAKQSDVRDFGGCHDGCGGRVVPRSDAVLWGVQLSIVYHPVGNAILGTAPLPLDWWGLMILFALPGFFVIEIEKWVTKRFGKQHGV